MDRTNKVKLPQSLLFRFALIFFSFTVVAVLFSGISTYVNQMRLYKNQCLENVRNIGDYLERLIQDSGKEFVDYQDYFMAHYADVDIPYDFDEYHNAHRAVDYLLSKSDPERFSDFSEVSYEALSDEEKKAIFIYQHEYWTLVFENARKAFNLPYTYYLVPIEDDLIMYYMIDGERSHKNADGFMDNEGNNLYLGDFYYDSITKSPVQWKTWFSGERLDDFQVWNNEWGHTYAYYTPLIINGRKMGLIGTEVEVRDVYKSIVTNTISQSLGVAAVLVICLAFMLFLLNMLYIKRIVQLEADLTEYVSEKNPRIAERIEKNVLGKNEISSLSLRFASMITEIENYIQSLRTTNKELDDTKKRADEMNILANRDSLTGIRNRTAYDNEFSRVEWDFQCGKTAFGFAMIDLNFLKQINDTYGHEHGNIAIKKLCFIVCNIFEHSPVFRFGGDEFVVVLEKSDYADVENLVKKFKDKIAEISQDNLLEPWERVSAAIGYALYDETVDKSVSDVFNRADVAMYTHKKAMKAGR